jgi:membrane-associated phospholipid phosphatase
MSWLPFLVLGLTLIPSRVLGQPAPDSADSSAGALPGRLLNDQKRIVSSPGRIRLAHLKWLLPLAGATGLLLATDRRNMQERIRTNPLAWDRSSTISNAGLGALAGIPLWLSWSGWHHGDDEARETGLASARAAIDGLLVAEALGFVTRRERPGQGGGAGRFLRSSPTQSSFPSRHSAVAWSIASVVADRYPGWLSTSVVYGLATAVSLSRITAREHFPSDVLVGSAMGWLVGRYVSRWQSGSRHGQLSFGPPPETGPPAASETSRERAGSPYIPMDSWVYPALDRLAALGLIPSQIAGLRPWTRAECRRQMLEADSALSARPGPALEAVAGRLIQDLRAELNEPPGGPRSVILESVSLRNGVIAGPVLNDSFHFGQTWINDFGRPFGQGWNSYAGFTARAEAGRFFALVRAEYQHAPGSAGYPLGVRQTISQLDDTPLASPLEKPVTDRFRPIEAYVGVRWSDFEFSLGKQALWWGPTYDPPLSFSSNAEPTKNFRISTIHPLRLPGFLSHLGGIRAEFIIGKLGGQQYTWRPWFNAQKLSFKLTDNLEMGFTRWSIFWGVGHPITLRSLARNLASANSQSPAGLFDPADPGDRKGGFDFRYRVPGLRNWLTIYSDSYSDDDPSPLAAPRRAAISPGLYLTHVPGIARLDLRVEAASTTPMSGDHGGQFVYYNNQYRSGNTNYGVLLGSWVGRDARAIQGWSTYWFSARNKIEAGYRQLKGGARFLPGGGTQTAATLKGSVQLPNHWYAEVAIQYERFRIPVLGGPERNLSAWVRLSWEPKLQLLGSRDTERKQKK